MARISALSEKDPSSGTSEYDELEVWSLLVRHYEDEHVLLENPSIKDVVEFRADQMGLAPTDLDAIFGGSGRRSEVLSGKRSLSKSMAARLQAIGVPASVLVHLLLDREPIFQVRRNPGNRVMESGKPSKQQHKSGGIAIQTKSGENLSAKQRQAAKKRRLETRR